MINFSVGGFSCQAKKHEDGELFSPNDLPDQKLDETIPLDLVGYAQSIIRLSHKKKSLRLNLPNTYLAKLWGVSVPTVNRKLKQLQDHRIILRMTSGGEKSCDGKFYRTRLIFIKPAHRAHNPTSEPLDHLTFNQMTPQPIDLMTSNQLSLEDNSASKSNLIIHKNTNLKDLDRTLQGEREKQVLNSFISTKDLKGISANRKRKPSKEVKNLQKTFLRQAMEKINEMHTLDYRFMCLLLRQVLGAESPTIGHYGTKLHLILRHKPELVVCAMDSLIQSIGTIRCPIAWFISELQSVGGFRDLIYSEEKNNEVVQALPKISKEGARALERFRAMEKQL